MLMKIRRFVRWKIMLAAILDTLKQYGKERED